MAMGLLGALLPDMSCSVRMCGECRGWGADTEPPAGPIFAGGEGGTSPATAWTVYRQRERERGRSNDINKCTTVLCGLLEKPDKNTKTNHIYMKLI